MATTHTDVGFAPKEPRSRWLVQSYFLIALAATVFCAITVIGAFTWIEDVNWITTGFATMGVIGFGGMTFRLWQELREIPKIETPFVLGLASAFWAIFGGMTAWAVIDQAFIMDDGADWPILTMLAVFVVLMLMSAYDLGRKAWQLRRKH